MCKDPHRSMLEISIFFFILCKILCKIGAIFSVNTCNNSLVKLMGLEYLCETNFNYRFNNNLGVFTFLLLILFLVNCVF